MYHNENDISLFKTIQIETFNRCNGECSFCPVNRHVDTRTPMFMSDELYIQIINELSDMDYCGRIALFSNNEPLLDMKLEERACIAKKYCPNAYIYLYTNGTLLSKERFINIIPWLDKIIIDNYNDELVLNANILAIHELCTRNSELDKKVEIHLRKENEVLYTRGGQAPNNTKRVERTYPCFLPFNQLVVRPDGKISLCCSDALGKITLGDINNATLKDIWYSKAYLDIRKQVFDDIRAIPLCRYCDSKHYN